MHQYQSLKDHVYQYITKELQEGRINIGDKINEQRVSETLGTSRTPVREAMIQLACEGVLLNEPRKGFRVNPLTLKSATDIYNIIGTLDAMAAALAIDKVSENDLNEMHRLHGEMQRLITRELYDEYHQTQQKFHDVYIARCGNQELIRLLDQLRLRFIKQGYYAIKSEGMQEVFWDTNSEHLQIVRLIASGKKQQLEKYVKEVHWSEKHVNFEI